MTSDHTPHRQQLDDGSIDAQRRRRRNRVLLFCAPILALPILGCITGPGCNPDGDGAPEPDRCSDGVTEAAGVVVQTVPRTEPFRPYAEGDGIEIVGGGQGANMVAVRIRLVGDAAPSCIAQTTEIRDADGAGLGMLNVPIRTYQQPDGSRLTEDMWIVLLGRPSPGERLQIVTEALGQTIESWVIADGALPVADGGTPGYDGGAPGYDGGAPGYDAGSPGYDAGSPDHDAGTGPSDAGTAPGMDAG